MNSVSQRYKYDVKHSVHLTGRLHFPLLWPNYFFMNEMCLTFIFIEFVRTQTNTHTHTPKYNTYCMHFKALFWPGIIIYPEWPKWTQVITSGQIIALKRMTCLGSLYSPVLAADVCVWTNLSIELETAIYPQTTLMDPKVLRLVEWEDTSKILWNGYGKFKIIHVFLYLMRCIQ